MIVIDKRSSNAGSFAQLPKNPTWEQVVTLFKIGVNESLGWAATPNGKACWRFIGVSLQEGPTVYQVQIQDQAGAMAPGILALRNYSSAPKFPAPITPAYFPNGEAGFSGASGDKLGIAEFSYAASSVVGPSGGPDSFWVSAGPNETEPQFSDLAANFGWLGGTNHLNPSPLFQYQVKDTTPPPVGGHYTLANLDAAGQIVGYIPFIDGAPPTPGGSARLAILKDGLIVGYQEWVMG